MSRPTLLAVTARLPVTLTDGYSLRVRHLLNLLAREWEVVLVGPAVAGAGQSLADVARVVEVPVQSTDPFVTFHGSADEASLRRAVRDTIDQHRPSVALLWSGTEFLAFDRFIPAVADRIDCLTLISWRAAASGRMRSRLSTLRSAAHFARYERNVVRSLSSTIVVGDDDARMLRFIARRGAVEVIPNGVVVPDAMPAPPSGGPPTLVFSGTLNYPPNIDAARVCALQILPGIRAVRPDALLLIVGRSPGPEVLELAAEPGVSVLADVPSVPAVLRNAWIALAPMRQGSGIKNKILEAWAEGRPVVMSKMAVNGLHVTEAVTSTVGDTPAEMVDIALRLVSDESERARVGRDMYDIAREHHGWQPAADRVSAALERAMRDKR